MEVPLPLVALLRRPMAHQQLRTTAAVRLFKEMLHSAAVPLPEDGASSELDELRTQMIASDLANEIQRLLALVQTRKLELVLSGGQEAETAVARTALTSTAEAAARR